MATEAIPLLATDQPVTGHPGAGKGYQKRIDKLTREKYAQRREIETLRVRLDEVEGLMARWKDVALRYKEVLNKRGLNGK